jgi:uncharacterized protein (TIGR00369 family)
LERVVDLPMSRLCELQPGVVSDGTLSLSAVAPGPFERTDGVAHGGAVAMIGQLGCAAALAAGLPNDTMHRRIDCTVDFLRPTGINVPLNVRARVAHRSRRVAMVTAEIVDDRGRLTARIAETAMVDGGEGPHA